jgi:DNA-binding NarL/FixJ family response regulator
MTTLFVIDDHPVLREGIKMLLEAGGDVKVSGTAATASGALEALKAQPPDVVLLDLDLGTEDGLEQLPRITAAAPSSKVLILTALRDRARDEEALQRGARGLVLKDAPPDVLVSAVRAVAGGGLWFDPRVLSAPKKPLEPRPGDRLANLTAREGEIVSLVVEGLRNEEVARRIGITEKTVRNHLTAVFDKVGVSSRLELVVLAFNAGYRKPGPQG